MHFARFDRIRLAHLPTPLEPMNRLSDALNGPRLWIKRDDCTGMSTGGNKTRKLEFLMGEALAQKADVVITQGATQSNHVRQTAAFCARLGLECHAILEDRTQSKDPDYRMNGNVLLDALHGATVEHVPADTDMVAACETAAAELRSKGKTPYIIPGGGSNPVGALGYANCALELVNQANEMGLKISRLIHATGSAGPQAYRTSRFSSPLDVKTSPAARIQRFVASRQNMDVFTSIASHCAGRFPRALSGRPMRGSSGTVMCLTGI